MRFCKNHAWSLLLCVVLIVAAALCMTACNDTAEIPAEGGAEVTFTFEVVDAEGAMETFEVTTDKATVGEALLEQGLIKGEDGPYGLYVTEVNGITADFDATGTYWAFYIDGGYAATGVDTTTAEDGAAYAFKVEK